MNEKRSLSIERIDNYRVRIPQQGSMITDAWRGTSTSTPFCSSVCAPPAERPAPGDAFSQDVDDLPVAPQDP